MAFPGYYITALDNKPFAKTLLQLPGVAPFRVEQCFHLAACIIPGFMHGALLTERHLPVPRPVYLQTAARKTSG